MPAFSFLPVLLLAASPVMAQTQYGTPANAKSGTPARSQNCPWFTEGSAARVLDGQAVVTVHVSDKGEGSCRFSRRPDSHEFLEIAVGGKTLPACPPQAMQLRAIGNQAARCSAPGGHGEEMISGRVRDQFFTITLAVHAQKGASKGAAVQDDALEQVAEQVAGNLY